MAAKFTRSCDIKFQISGNDAQSLEYNPASGGQKSLIVGPRLLPIPIASGYTTNAAAGLVLPYLGANLAIYNNAGTAAAITVSPATAAALAIGATDANGNVGVACPPNAWSYVSAGANQYIITSAATLIVYLIEDPTKITQETGPYAQQNPGPYAQNAVST
jgi:hypothetical protein